MAELDPKVKQEVEACLAAADEAAIHQFTEVLRQLDRPETKFRSALWLEVARRFRAGIHKTPPCFHLHLYEELKEALNPSLHLDLCRHYDGEDDRCKIGLVCDDCDECSSYEPDPHRIGSAFECANCPFKCEWNLR